MATTTLSLFPSASFKNGSAGQKGALRYVSRSVKEPDFEMVKMSGNAHGIVIAVEETPAQLSSTSTSNHHRIPDRNGGQAAVPSATLTNPPQVRVADRPNRAPTPAPIVTQVRTPVDQRLRSASPPAVRLVASPTRSRAPSPLQSDESPKSQASSPTLVRKGSGASTRTATHSPMMRSMFPRYDPDMTVASRRHQPHAQAKRTPPVAPGLAHSPSLYSQQSKGARRLTLPVLDIPQTSTGSAPVLQQVSQAPSSSAISTPAQLPQLWRIANGQAVVDAADIYCLELSCDSLILEEEIIAFSSTSQAFYTLCASRNGVAISRTQPSRPQPTVQICETALSVPSTTSPLVATVSPKLAELMALDQSSSIAVSHKLDRQASAELQAEGLARAQQNEAASLLWDSDSGKFFLIHPTLLDNASTNFPIDIIPSAANPERIVISAPETDASTPLLTLALASRTLTIHTTAVTALPSLYTLDTLLSALLCLLLHLHRSSTAVILPNTQKVNTIVPTFPPPPTLLPSSARSARSKKRSWSSWYRATFSPSSNTPLAHKIADEESGVASTPTAVQASRSDSESDWGYRPMIDVEDESLPAATRAVLKTVYWGFEVLIWLLGLFVNLLAAGVVGAGKLIKKL